MEDGRGTCGKEWRGSREGHTAHPPLSLLRAPSTTHLGNAVVPGPQVGGGCHKRHVAVHVLVKLQHSLQGVEHTDAMATVLTDAWAWSVQVWDGESGAGM